MNDRGPLFGERIFDVPEARPSPLVHPTRWPAIVGLALLAIGQVMPWATFSDGTRTILVGAASRGSEGFVAFLFGLFLLAMVASRSVAESGTRTAQLLPGVLGYVVLLVVAIGVQSTELAVREPALVLDTSGSFGNSAVDAIARIEPGMWVALTGAALVALGGSATSFLIVSTRPVHRDMGPSAIDRGFVEDVAVGVVAVPIGGLVGGGVATAIGAAPVAVIWSIIGCALLGIAVGVGVRRSIRTR